MTPPPVFFTDRNLGKRFPQMLRDAGLTVERHEDHFVHDCPDETWLEGVGQQGWVAITHDKKIRYKPNELAAVIQHRVPLLIVIGDAPFSSLATSFVSTQARILEFVAKHQPPYIAKVYRPAAKDLAADPHAPGRIEYWHP
jgi:PIN like domain